MRIRLMTASTIKRPFGPPIYYSTLSEEFMKVLVEIAVESKAKNINIGNKLAGNIANQCKAVISHKQYEPFVEEVWQQISTALKGFDDEVVTDFSQLNFNLGDGPWINFQKANEFNPYHNHSGMLSAVLYIDVPEQIKEENDNVTIETNMPRAGMIAFISGNDDRYTRSSYCHQSKTGEIFIFPASLNHLVYPFKSDVERISMSFNVCDIIRK